MKFRKTGFPEEGEVLLCTVTKIYHHSVFVNIDEYDISGMIHISEISAGRIRNIRDYVAEGKKVVCKVLRIDQQKGHVDLSLRRVKEIQRRNKIEELKQEQVAEKILEFVAGKHKLKFDEVYKQVQEKAAALGYDHIFEVFEDVVIDECKTEELGLGKAVCKELEETIKQRISAPEVQIKGEFRIATYAANGVKTIREALKHGKRENTDMKYLGAGRYSLIITAEDYKLAEKDLEDITKKVIKVVEDDDGTVEWIRVEE